MNTLNHEDALETARKIVAEAGRYALSEFGNVGVSYKSDGSMVTQTDRAIEDLIRERLAESYPDHSVLGEEEGFEGLRDAPNVWIVDPIDGTNNFFYGLPLWGVSLGLVRDNRPVVGALYMPCFDQMFTAADGLGVFCNAHPIRVRDGHDIGPNELLTISSPSLGRWSLDISMKPRIFGCASFAMVSVAAGISRALIHSSYYIWDAAAALCMMQQAGAVVTDPEGNSLQDISRWDLKKHGPRMIAAGPQTHEIIVEKITFHE
ncbi:MAG: inositol monophosphatase family protein [Armatimonadota bacterium]